MLNNSNFLKYQFHPQLFFTSLDFTCIIWWNLIRLQGKCVVNCRCWCWIFFFCTIINIWWTFFYVSLLKLPLLNMLAREAILCFSPFLLLARNKCMKARVKCLFNKTILHQVRRFDEMSCGTMTTSCHTRCLFAVIHSLLRRYSSCELWCTWWVNAFR